MQQAQLTAAFDKTPPPLEHWAATRLGTIVADHYVVLDVEQVDGMTVTFIACDMDVLLRVLVSALCRPIEGAYEVVDVDVAPLEEDQPSRDALPIERAPAPRSKRKPTGGWLGLLRRSSDDDERDRDDARDGCAHELSPGRCAPAKRPPTTTTATTATARADVASSGWLAAVLDETSQRVALRSRPAASTGSPTSAATERPPPTAAPAKRHDTTPQCRSLTADALSR